MNASSQVLYTPNDNFCLREVFTENVCERYRGTISNDLHIFVVGFL